MQESPDAPENTAAAPDPTPDGGTCSICSYPRPESCMLCGTRIPKRGPGFAPLDLVRGFLFYWKGAFRLNEKAYLGRIALAIVLGVAVFLGLVAAAVWWIHPFIAGLLHVEWLPSWLNSIGGVGTAVLLTFLTAAFAFPVLIMLLMFPMLDPIARTAEEEALGFPPVPHARGSIADFWDSIDTGARILAFQVLAWLLCLPLAMTGFGFPVALAIAGFFAGFSWLDYPASRRGLKFREKWAIARRHWALMTGFGLAFLTGTLVPFFNLCIAGPAGAVGAADLWFACDKDDLLER